MLDAGDPCTCKHYIAHGKWCSCTLAALAVREDESVSKCWKPPPDETVREALIAVFGAEMEAPVYNPVAREGLTRSDLHEASEETVGKSSSGRPRKNRVPSKGHLGTGKRGKYKCDRCGKTGHRSTFCNGAVMPRRASAAKKALAAAKAETQRNVSKITEAASASARAAFVVNTHASKIWQDIHDLKLTDEEIAATYETILASLKNDCLITPSDGEQERDSTTELTEPAARGGRGAATPAPELADLELRMSTIATFQAELAAAKKCRVVKVEPMAVRPAMVETAVSRMTETFALLSKATQSYLLASLSDCVEQRGGESGLKSDQEDEERTCFICLAGTDEEEEEDDLKPLICGQCSKPGLDPKWIHDKCVQSYVLSKLSAGVHVDDIKCPLCRASTGALSLGAHGGVRTNVSGRFHYDWVFVRVVCSAKHFDHIL
jgi:hypothetical protein